MKKMELNQMEELRGGGFWDGAYSGFAVASFAFLVGAVSFGAGAAVSLGAADTASGVYAMR